METLVVQLKFVEPLLGSQPNDKDIHLKYIASKNPDRDAQQEENDAINPEATFEKGTSVFPRNNNGLFLYDYQVRGFFKEAIAVGIELGEVKGLSKWNHKKAVDSLLFITPRRIYLTDPSGAVYKQAPAVNTRPIRMDTMQGERVALVTSEELPEGTLCEFTVCLLTGDNKKSKLAVLDRDHLTWALNYGLLKGFGQWRSGGFGRFSWSEKAK